MLKKLKELRAVASRGTVTLCAAAIVSLVSPFAASAGSRHSDGGKARSSLSQIEWLNHLKLLPGDPTVTSTQYQQHTSFGTNVEGLVITSSTTGDVDSNNEDKFVSMALVTPKQTKITGVRLCYEMSDPGVTGSFIDDIRLAQFNNTNASTATVLLDDTTDQDASGPTCVTSMVTSAPPFIDASKGTVVLSLRVDFANINDQIVVRALGLLVK